LGNPGKKYELTRHNAGFLLLDYITAQNKLTFSKSENDYLIAKGELFNSPFLFIKPTTYMNLSGQAVVNVKEKYNIDPGNLLVVHDDINLDIGKVKIKQSGGDGGHNGIASIIYHLNSNVFPRLRIGIGNNFKEGEQINFVLSKFKESELAVLSNILELSFELINHFISNGMKSMLDYYSSQVIKKSDS